MGHAGAIITGEAGQADTKVQALRKAGARIIPTPSDIGSTVQEALAAALAGALTIVVETPVGAMC